MVVLVIAGLGVAGWIHIIPDSKIPIAVPFLMQTQHVVDRVTFGVGMSVLALGLVAMLMARRFLNDGLGDKGLARTLSFLSIIGSLPGLWIVMGPCVLSTPSVSWVFQAPAWTMMALTPVLVGYSGSLRLLVPRSPGHEGAK